MANSIDAWKKMIGGRDIAKEVKEIEKNGGNGDYPDIPEGEYVVKVTSLELKGTKKDNLPMLAAQCKILEGKYKGQNIFVNLVLRGEYPISIHTANEFLRGLDEDVEVEYTGDVEEYIELINDIFENINGKFEYALEISKNDKGYPEYKINDVYTVKKSRK